MNTKKPVETKRPLTVREAGRKGGATTAERHGHDHYHAIGKKGGQRVKELIERARAADAQPESE
jgi:general stress protein YciG